jgi:hypothetical protein
MINYLIYSNTSYLDILEIQTDYISNKGNLTLLIDDNNLDIGYIYEKYNKVVFYNNNDTYAKRLETCLNQIEYDYFLLIHDIDILLNVETQLIEKFLDLMILNSIDRIDLKYDDYLFSDRIVKINSDELPSNWVNCETKDIDSDSVFLIKQNNPKKYIYNVNPSLWKKDVLYSIVSNFSHKTYRTIEDTDVQDFCKNFNIYKMYSENHIECGYFKCLNIFLYLHISHGGKLLPLNDNFSTIYGQSYKSISQEYKKIVDKYDLKKSDKWAS